MRDFWDTGLDLKGRVLYLIGEVDPVLQATALRGIHLLNKVRKPFTIKLSSGGGDVLAGMSIYDAIRLSPCRVTIIGAGQVQSMAPIIFQAADHRILEAGATVMLHDGSMSDGSMDMKAYERWGDWSKESREWTYKLLAAKTKRKDKSFWQQVCSSDAIFNAHQALDLGLCDKVI